MPNHPKLIKLPGTFFDALDRLLKTAPPPKTAAEKAERERASKTLRAVKARGARNRKKHEDAEAKEARANAKKLLDRARGKGTRKKSR